MRMVNRTYARPVTTQKKLHNITFDTLDLLSDLTHAITEEEVFREIIRIFSAVFQPQDILYIALQGEAVLSVHPHNAPTDVTQSVIRHANDHLVNGSIMDISGKVIFPIAYQSEIFGVVSLDFGKKAKPDQPSIDSGYRLSNYAGVVISNLRMREKLGDFLVSSKTSPTEGLSSLSSRHYFFEIAEAEFRRSKRYNRPLSAILVDVDNFKTLDDTYGSEAGDRILMELSHFFDRELRESDIRVRLSGEELLILLPETNMRFAHVLAERLRRRIAETVFEVGNQTTNLTISIGVVTLDKTIKSLEELVSNCDRALNQAKRCGKNQVAAWATPLVEYGPTFQLPESDFHIGFY